MSENESYEGRWNKGETQRPMPITGVIPKNIEEINQHGSVFAQQWARWDESHLLSIEGIANASLQLANEIKEKYDNLRIDFIELRTLFHTSLNDSRLVRDKMIETIQSQKDMFDRACDANKTVFKKWDDFLANFTSQIWIYVLGTGGISLASVIVILEFLHLIGRL